MNMELFGKRFVWHDIINRKPHPKPSPDRLITIQPSRVHLNIPQKTKPRRLFKPAEPSKILDCRSQAKYHGNLPPSIDLTQEYNRLQGFTDHNQELLQRAKLSHYHEPIIKALTRFERELRHFECDINDAETHVKLFSRVFRSGEGFSVNFHYVQQLLQELERRQVRFIEPKLHGIFVTVDRYIQHWRTHHNRFPSHQKFARYIIASLDNEKIDMKKLKGARELDKGTAKIIQMFLRCNRMVRDVKGKLEATERDFGERMHNVTGMVKKLPTVTFRKGLFEPHESCSVCFVHYRLGEKVAKLLCGHFFHPHCLIPWFSKRRTCPLCRHNV